MTYIEITRSSDCDVLIHLPDQEPQNLYNIEEDVGTPQSQVDIVRALYDLHQTKGFGHGDYFVFEDRIVARVDGVHVVSVSRQESVDRGFVSTHALSHPGEVLYKFNMRRVDGERDWDSVRVEVPPVAPPRVQIKIGKMAKTPEALGALSGVCLGLEVSMRSGLVPEFRSVEFYDFLKNCVDALCAKFPK